MERVKEVSGISPILQRMLIEQISKVMDALNKRQLMEAWSRLQVLVSICPPKVKEALIGKDEELTVRNAVELASREIGRVAGLNSVDFFTTHVYQNRKVKQLLREIVPWLFELTVEKLYEGNYLESYREYYVGHEIT